MTLSSTIRKSFAGFILLAISAGAFAQSKGFDPSRMDTSAQACTDFFQYANGNWIKTTEIPADKSRFGSFDILLDRNRDIMREVLEAAAKDSKAARGSDSQLIGDFYSACMDEAAIEKADAKPLQPYFSLIDKTRNSQDLIKTIAMLHQSGFPAVFGFGAGPDIKNSSMYIVNTGQGGLSLPNRDYYTKDDAKSQEIRTKFVEHMTNMFKLLGDAPEKAAANASTVLRIQTRLANASKTPVEMRNPENRYSKMPVAQAKEITPNIGWDAYFTTRGTPAFAEINIAQPDFFREVNKMMTDVSIEDWKTYLRWMVLNSAAPRISKRFVDENFNFFGRTLTGAKEQQPRWRRCIAATDNYVGEALGQEFVKRTFTPEAKARMNQMIDNLIAAFRERIQQLDWMSPETKQQALVKLSTFKRKIGYPDKLRGYQGLAIDRKSFFENTVRGSGFEINRNVRDIGNPVDRGRWGYNPPTVNASYSSVNNDITFPAGILQPPFFNFAADDAINYGAIGAVIGHEVTHGFDDQGSKFDAEGNFKMWWTAEDRQRFEEKANCVANQFASYEVLPGLKMNGRLTLGENIADLGGLTMAYYAFQKSLGGNKSRPANIDGFTPEQRFFLGWAQVWAAKATDEATRSQVLGDPHALPRWRVNGPLANLPQFAQAFGCKAGDAMVREENCRIW
jgi:putative endopeptidase